ncbi:MAG: AAA family ATPase [Bacteroidales bacterium]|nr:AAA family ATPase [Bacteroidales bacterium]
MLKTIRLQNFKAFHEEVFIDFNNKQNILIGGENGSGKSTIFEAMKYVFYYDRLLSEHIPITSVGDEREAEVLQFKKNYNNRKYKTVDFSLLLNESPIDSFNKENYLVYLISGDNIRRNNTIVLSELFRSVYFNNSEIDSICNDTDMFELILSDVNSALKEKFHESIQLELTQSIIGECRINDETRDLHENKNLKSYFNEAKLDLVNLLLLFSFIEACRKNEEKNRIIILDDFITSLDATNRILIIRYFFEKFGQDYQKIVLTHNQSFFNLIKYIVENASSEQKGSWTYQTLYEFRNEHKIYIYEGSDDLENIKKDYKAEKNKLSPSFESIGNRLRQRFEVLLYELARLMQIGHFEESKSIISSLVDNHNKSVFLKMDGNKILNTYTLLEDLIRIFENTSIRNDKLRSCLKKKYKEYVEFNELNHLKPIIRDMRIYQKVILHQLSHGRDEIPTNSPKEIETTIELLSKMESVVNKKHGVNIDVYTV